MLSSCNSSAVFFLGACVVCFVFVFSRPRAKHIVSTSRYTEHSISNTALAGSDYKIEGHVLDLAAVEKSWSECRSLCLLKKGKLRTSSWSSGPCLSSSISDTKDSKIKWGCDIAHCPRRPVDENKVNQCNQTHWIELDTSCDFLRFREGLENSRQGVLCNAEGSKKTLF